MSNGSEHIREYETHCPTCDAPEPTHTPTCAVPYRDNFDSLRSLIAALEADVREAIRILDTPLDTSKVLDTPSGRALWKATLAYEVRIHLLAAPSTVLDQVIREAKAEAVEAARDAIMPPVNWNLRPDGTEMPGTQHIDGALHDIHVQLTQMAADIRNGGA